MQVHAHEMIQLFHFYFDEFFSLFVRSNMVVYKWILLFYILWLLR